MYIVKRIAISIPLLFGITILSFAIMQWAPGDPATMFTDPSISIQDMAQVRANLGLDKPMLVQYVIWLKNLLAGNMGFSYVSGKPVLTAILERLPATLFLSISSFILIMAITFPLGLISGYKKGSRFDHWVTVLSFIGLSVPTFWLGLVLILIFSLYLNAFPTSGMLDPALIHAPLLAKSLNILHHMALPLLTIVLGGIASLTRYHRFGIISILNQPYIQAARARGISEKRLLFKHAFKNAAQPIVTILGLDLPALMSGSFVIEYIFGWPGMGQLGITAVFSRDYPILMGTIVFSAILIITGNFLADIAYAYIDPRIQKK